MTKIYFVRHAQSDRLVRDGRTRPLTQEGIRDSRAVTWVLEDKDIDLLMSSPYKRSMDTIADLAKTLGMEIHTDEDLRERNAGGWHYSDDKGGDLAFFDFVRKQWEDLSYRFGDGECLAEVQRRNIRAVDRLLNEHRDKNIVIATHGTALSTILSYYYPEYGYEQFLKIMDLMPFIIRLDFEGEECAGAQVELAIRKRYKCSSV